jgi:alpha-beta hydrolase superfamily lysophospholipase/ubiquinone/menaquinone biosynthesis C-methylase UbiE
MTVCIGDIPAEAAPSANEKSFAATDGTPLFYRAWLPAGKISRAIVLFHRGHEHSGRFAGLANALRGEETALFAWDARGHGRSPGERGWAASFPAVVRDLDAFVTHVSREYHVDVKEMAVVGHSVGAVAVAAWVHDYAPPIRAMVLVTPAFRVKLYVPFALLGLRLLNAVKKKAFITSYVRSKVLTHDPIEQKRYDQDPLISKQIAVNILLDLYDLSTRLIDDAGAIVTPTLVLTAGSDWVVKPNPQRTFFERLSSPIKQHQTYAGFYHALLHEKNRAQPIADICAFIEQAFESPAKPPSLLDADQRGYASDEYQRLQRPLPALSPKNISFAVQRVAMKTLLRLSKGVRIGSAKGFDSGESLDHVYRDRAEGITLLGKLIDRIYLNAIGWRGIRRRKQNLQSAIGEGIDARKLQPTHIVDIASGPGRYLLEMWPALSEWTTATLRDCSESGLEAGRVLAREWNIKNVTFEIGDAFSFQSLSSMRPAPDIVIVSGLYELFPDNAKILESLRGIAAALKPGGRLIYTGQPWHPQVEMIARVLTNREKKPWIMRRRTQREMDELVESVGFRKIKTKIDDFGIFTVSTAVRGET